MISGFMAAEVRADSVGLCAAVLSFELRTPLLNDCSKSVGKSISAGYIQH